MPKLYEGIEKDAFHLASAYFGIMEMVMKDATLDQIVNFLANREETDLPDIACRVINGGEDLPVPIDGPRLRLVHSAPIKGGE
jgi:hypothetical protein